MKKTFCNSIIGRTRQGSALLIVLGMASFMMVSAIAFAVYMRESRLPSSHLRRQVSSRYLLKAALANAIDRLDGQFASYRDIAENEIGDVKSYATGLTEGIYDDPYPGVGPSRNNSNSEDIRARNYGNRNGDLWIDRVFTPFGQVDSRRTVPTLTLESLAYLPPAIINEVRISSRKTRTAMWRNLSYEFGRYAFCAVNVSDCFDINRLSAANRRTSAPGERISMASLFRKGKLSDLDSSRASAFDDILDKAGNVPFVSLADFNIAAGQSPFSPFYEYVGSAGGEFYNAGDSSALSNALFITDTWFPPTNRNTSVKLYNLAGQQPFKAMTENAAMQDVITGQNQFYRDLQTHIGIFGMCCLYDYLDKDHRPLSFCIPTVETVPMVTGIGLKHNSNIKPKVEASPLGNPAETIFKDPEDKPDGLYTYKREAIKYVLSDFAGGPVPLTGTVMFPFRRTKDKGIPTSFTGDALVRVWWAPKNISGRLSEDSPVYPAKDDWNKQGLQMGANGIATFVGDLTSLGLNIKDEPTTEQAMGNFNATLELDQIADQAIFWHIKDTTVKQEKDENGNLGPEVVVDKQEYCTLNGIAEGDSKPLVAYKADGTPAAYWDEGAAKKKGPELKGKKIEGDFDRVGSATRVDNGTYVMHLAVWVRIKNGEDVVDMVPARLSDDDDFGNGAPALTDDFVGGGSPILEFCGAKELVLEHGANGAGATALKGEVEEFSNWDRLYCADPRFNWAPENWVAMNSGDGQGGNATKDEWIKKLGADGKQSGGLMTQADRDHDIFMFTSDQEYLQSIGELAFLPFVGWGAGGGFETYRDQFRGEFDGSSVANRINKLDTCTCYNMFWKTYNPFDDPIYSFDGRMEVVSGRGDFRANPFSDDIRVLLAALANTPYDYYIASTNASTDVNKFTEADMNESLNHAFNDKGSVARFEDDVVWDIADVIHDKFQAKARSGSFDWVDAFDDLAWFDGNKCGEEQLEFLGVELDDPLYGVDRKFLYSYWRECFQNRQQLFLVFIRAEPLSVGGSSGDSLANAQLGARGVALVWRDPQPPQANRGDRTALGNVTSWRTGGVNGPRPHRTRVLFYHQFE